MINTALIFDTVIAENRLQIRLSATMEQIDKADEQIRLFLSANNLAHLSFPACLLMREGMTNAVKHGSRLQSEKMIYLTVIVEKNEVTLEIEDEGEGFDWRSASGKQPDLNADHGRGLAIIKQYSTSYRYNETGTKLFMVLSKR